jgi:hypothetical protein
LSIVLPAAALLVLVAGVARAAIPDSNDGEIYGCYEKNQGQLHVIDLEGGETCRPAELAPRVDQHRPGRDAHEHARLVT